MLAPEQLRICFQENRAFRLIEKVKSPWYGTWDCWLVEDLITSERVRRHVLCFSATEFNEMQILAWAAKTPQEPKDFKRHPCFCGTGEPWNECCGISSRGGTS